LFRSATQWHRKQVLGAHSSGRPTTVARENPHRLGAPRSLQCSRARFSAAARPPTMKFAGWTAAVCFLATASSACPTAGMLPEYATTRSTTEVTCSRNAKNAAKRSAVAAPRFPGSRPPGESIHSSAWKGRPRLKWTTMRCCTSGGMRPPKVRSSVNAALTTDATAIAGTCARRGTKGGRFLLG
jgi:hypothetical protein